MMRKSESAPFVREVNPPHSTPTAVSILTWGKNYFDCKARGPIPSEVKGRLQSILIQTPPRLPSPLCLTLLESF